jgi:ubiquinone/menaquinone biosynthesis C-methylase UbiE
MDTNSENYYDAAAARYTEMSSARRKYLQGVDQIVIQHLSDIHAETLLDIGAGDGRRTKRLADTLGIRGAIAVEKSLKMAAKAREQLGERNVLEGDAMELELPAEYFDAVICLWNVFGHIPNKRDRIEMLRKVSKSLKPNGKCIIDVNNRYNIRHYGWFSVVCNVVNDLIYKTDAGWFSLQMNGVLGKVYIHRPAELKKYLSNLNLKVDGIYYVDYASGALRRTSWEGQCVYVLSRIK